MRRLSLVLTAALVALAGTAMPVLAGRQSGPEQLAKGRGAVEASSSTTTVLDEICFIEDPTVCFSNAAPAATITVTTDISQTFDFDARSGPQESPLDPADGPSGHIKVVYDVTTTTTVAPGPNAFTCDDDIFFVVGGCPEFGTTTTNESAAATAQVTCLTVVQNRAAIGGHVTRWEGNFAPTRGILLNVTDNTVARQQVGGPDRFLAALVTDVPYVCPAPTADHPITKGDIYVDQS